MLDLANQQRDISLTYFVRGFLQIVIPSEKRVLRSTVCFETVSGCLSLARSLISFALNVERRRHFCVRRLNNYKVAF